MAKSLSNNEWKIIILLFKKFPYNCRYCHIDQKNQLIITEGIDNETTACYYDDDTNAVEDLLKWKHKDKDMRWSQ